MQAWDKLRALMVVAVAVAACAASLALPATAVAAQDMLVGIEQNGGMEQDALRPDNLDRMKALDAQIIRFVLRFDRVAVCDPAGAAASNPGNACYNWAVPDALVRDATQRNMKVMLSIVGVPPWMFNKTYGYVGDSEAQYARFLDAYGDFVTAAALHYSGGVANTPRVDYWTIWNEPNSGYFFSPQSKGKKLIAPGRYAQLYDIGARAMKGVDNRFVVATGPLSSSSTTKPGTFLTAALPAFKKRKSPVDAFAMNPYIKYAADPKSGAKGQQPPSVRLKWPRIGLGNLDDLTRTLDANTWSKHLPVWVTEFSYETTPDPDGATMEQQSEWLADSLFTAWADPRVQMFIWYALYDDGTGGSEGWQSGLYSPFFACTDQKWCAKPAAAMFRQPTYVSASRAKKGATIKIWGQGRSNPQSTRIYIWQGGEWQVFQNAPDSNGALFISWKLRVDTWFVTCDTACGPIRKVTVR